jgi:hypothetical protein
LWWYLRQNSWVLGALKGIQRGISFNH